MDHVARGITRTARGLRTGDQKLVYLGIGLVLFDLLRRSRSRPALVYRRDLKPGQAVTVRLPEPAPSKARRGQTR
jgi:hypothetical protein